MTTAAICIDVIAVVMTTAAICIVAVITSGDRRSSHPLRRFNSEPETITLASMRIAAAAAAGQHATAAAARAVADARAALSLIHI